VERVSIGRRYNPCKANFPNCLPVPQLPSFPTWPGTQSDGEPRLRFPPPSDTAVGPEVRAAPGRRFHNRKRGHTGIYTNGRNLQAELPVEGARSLPPERAAPLQEVRLDGWPVSTP